ncbi:hypothetical protein D3C85_1744390 [compost metagenome]
MGGLVPAMGFQDQANEGVDESQAEKRPVEGSDDHVADGEGRIGALRADLGCKKSHNSPAHQDAQPEPRRGRQVTGQQGHQKEETYPGDRQGV